MNAHDLNGYSYRRRAERDDDFRALLTTVSALIALACVVIGWQT